MPAEGLGRERTFELVLPNGRTVHVARDFRNGAYVGSGYWISRGVGVDNNTIYIRNRAGIVVRRVPLQGMRQVAPIYEGAETPAESPLPQEEEKEREVEEWEKNYSLAQKSSCKKCGARGSVESVRYKRYSDLLCPKCTPAAVLYWLEQNVPLQEDGTYLKNVLLELQDFLEDAGIIISCDSCGLYRKVKLPPKVAFFFKTDTLPFCQEGECKPLWDEFFSKKTGGLRYQEMYDFKVERRNRR